MSGKRRRKFDLPEEFDIPGGLTADEVDEAISIFTSLKVKFPKENQNRLWKQSVSIVIATSEDFTEINGVQAFIKYAPRQEENR